jgi:hypothetical protein
MNRCCQRPYPAVVERSQPTDEASNRRSNAIDGRTTIKRSSSHPCHAPLLCPPGADSP